MSSSAPEADPDATGSETAAAVVDLADRDHGSTRHTFAFTVSTRALSTAADYCELSSEDRTDTEFDGDWYRFVEAF